MLLDRPLTVTEISRISRQPISDTASDVEHLSRSLKHTEYVLSVEAAVCKKCGFTFGPEKLTKPSKCPKCKSTWITEPRISVTRS